MDFDDLFTDSDDQHLHELESEVLESGVLEPDRWSDAALERRNAHVDSIVQRNQAVLEAADHHLRQAQHIRHAVFGDDDVYDKFIAGIEDKLVADAHFQDKYQQLSVIHEEVVGRERAEDARYEHSGQRKLSQNQHQKSRPAHTFIPGQPVIQSTEAVINRRNHILRKDMV